MEIKMPFLIIGDDAKLFIRMQLVEGRDRKISPIYKFYSLLTAAYGRTVKQFHWRWVHVVHFKHKCYLILILNIYFIAI